MTISCFKWLAYCHLRAHLFSRIHGQQPWKNLISGFPELKLFWPKKNSSPPFDGSGYNQKNHKNHLVFRVLFMGISKDFLFSWFCCSSKFCIVILLQYTSLISFAGRKSLMSGKIKQMRRKCEFSRFFGVMAHFFSRENFPYPPKTTYLERSVGK